MSPYVRLVLIFPPRLEALLTEALSADAALPGFTLLHGEGHSRDFSHASSAEQVRGRVQRLVLWMLLPQEDVDYVLALLRAQVDMQDVRWWTEPVLALGNLR
ncbi:MAG: DUF3240 family protein [Sterolibacterium sp.]|nr:DUF3240 family protein [Sterolibacterium sp.]